MFGVPSSVARALVRVSHRHPCPICEHDHWCYFLPGEDAAVVCMRQSDGAVREMRDGGWLHRLDGTAPRPRPTLAAAPGGQAARRDPALLDRVYRRLLRLLPLSPADREALGARGLTDAEIESGMYRSGPVRDRGTLARHLLEDLGPDALRGVPGCYVDAGRYGDYWSLRAATGIVVPVCDEQDRIVGIQVRRSGDEPGPRYIWWSSKDMRGGASPGAPLGWFGAAGEAGRVWVTEGPVKAAIAASRLGARVVAVPGVGAWRSAGLVERVRAGGYTEVVIAYDADAAANVQVAREAHGLCEALVTAGVRVSFATWDAAAGKGIDDLLVAGGRPEIASPRDWEERLPDHLRAKAIGRANRVLTVPVAMMPAPAPPARVHTLEQARREMPGIIRRALRAPKGAEPRLTILQATTGTGKTTALRTVLEGEVGREGAGRTLILMRSHDAIADALSGIGPALRAAMVDISTAEDDGGATGSAIHMAGRSADPESPAYCARYDLAKRYGEARHSVGANLCRGAGQDDGECPFAAGCPYLALRRRAEAAQIVFAAYPSYINAADDILSFDSIVIDEDCIPALVETAAVTAERIAEWRDVAAHLTDAKGDDYQQHMTFLGVLETAMQAAGQQSPGSVPALSMLREAAGARGFDLGAMVKGCLQDETDKQGRYGFERPCQVRRGQTEIVPLRLLGDLYQAIEAEVREPRSDTRLRFERVLGVVPALVLRQPYAHAIDALQSKQVVVTDATPSPLWRAVRPGCEIVRYDVPQHLELVQIYNRLLTVADQRDPATKALVQAAIQREVDLCRASGGEAVILGRKALAPGRGANRDAYEPVEGADWGWLGNHSRALNDWEHCTLMILVGYYQPPVEAVRAMVEALRWGEPTLQAPARERRVYRWRDRDGSGRARWRDLDRDVLVQSVLDHAVEAEIRQGIGRLRAVNADSAGPPKRILLLTGAVTSLPIDQLVRLEDLAGRAAPSPRAMPAACAERRDAANAARRVEAEQRALDAAERIAAEGRPVTVAAVRAASGVRYEAAKAAITRLLPVIEGVVRQEPYIDIDDISRTTPSIEQSDVGERAEAPDGDPPPLCAPQPRKTGLAASVRRWAEERCRLTDPKRHAPTLLDTLLTDFRAWSGERVGKAEFAEALTGAGATVYSQSVVTGLVLR